MNTPLKNKENEYDIRDLIKSRDKSYFKSYFTLGWKTKLAQKILEDSLNYHSEERLVYENVSTSDVLDWVESLSYKTVSSTNGSPFFIYDEDFVVEIKLTERNIFATIKLNIFTRGEERNEEIFEEIENHFPEALEDSHVRFDWYFYDGANLRKTSFDDFINDTFHEEAYPIFDDQNFDGVKDWGESYLDSTSPLIFLFGPPGTGKTRFIRYISKKASEKFDGYLKVMYISGPETISLESVFVKFIENSYDFLVIEDLDEKIKPRTEGNSSMTSLLTTSDGVVSTLNKKILITSNIPSIGEHDIDQALLRSGRCFDFKKFKKLNYNQSKHLLEKLGHEDFTELDKNKEYPISDLYYLSEHGNFPKKQKEVGSTGFNPKEGL